MQKPNNKVLHGLWKIWKNAFEINISSVYGSWLHESWYRELTALRVCVRVCLVGFLHQNLSMPSGLKPGSSSAVQTLGLSDRAVWLLGRTSKKSWTCGHTHRPTRSRCSHSPPRRNKTIPALQTALLYLPSACVCACWKRGGVSETRRATASRASCATLTLGDNDFIYVRFCIRTKVTRLFWNVTSRKYRYSC